MLVFWYLRLILKGHSLLPWTNLTQNVLICHGLGHRGLLTYINTSQEQI